MAGAGPIPRSAVLAFSSDWPPGEQEMFMAVIRALDHQYLNPLAEDNTDSTNPARDSFRATMKG